MCRACGEFTTAVKEGETFVPISDECPACGGVEFTHNDSRTVIRADD